MMLVATRCLVALAALGILGLTTPCLAAECPAPAAVAATVVAPALVAQGQAFLVTLRTPLVLRDTQVDFLGHRFQTWAETQGGESVVHALVAAGADDPAGSHRLIFSGTDPAGNRAAFGQDVQVYDGAFGEQRLRLPKAMVRPDAATLERIAAEKARLAERLATAAPERLWDGRFVRPVPGALLSRFGLLRVLNDEPCGRHYGVDLRAAQGQPVRAAAGGRVAVAEPFYFEGNLVVLDHGLGLATIYCHLSQTNVKEGESVAAGQVIGLAGATGRATGPHLHFGARLGDVRLDPFSLYTLTAGARHEHTQEPKDIRGGNGAVGAGGAHP